jgi:AraC-like DNA-binding protein
MNQRHGHREAQRHPRSGARAAGHLARDAAPDQAGRVPDAPPPFEYVSVRPDGRLAEVVAEVWFARGTIRGVRERIAPTGSTVLGIVLGDPIRQVPGNGRGQPFLAERGFVIGPHDRPIINEPTGGTWAVGVVTTPTGARAALGVRPATVRGRIVEPEWSVFEAVRRDLLRDPGAAASIDLVLDALEAGLDLTDPGLPRVAAAVRAIELDPVRPISAIALELGVSHGHLDREFARIVGLSPRVLARILRLRRLVESIDVYGQVAWTRLAAELGWFDQAHLIRDFKRFAGVSPGEYAEAQRTLYAPADAHPGFIPEPSD